MKKTKISIIYITARLEPKLDWFVESLMRQCGDRIHPIEVIVVDLFKDTREGLLRPIKEAFPNTMWKHVSPLPSFCQGADRLTKEDWFDAAAARNAGFVYATNPYVAFVDDVSILMPGWLEAVENGAKNGDVLLGAYQKHSKMRVENGLLRYSNVEEKDIDHRWKYGSSSYPVPAYASWFYGCSFAMPLEVAIEVNGFDEMGAMIGQEDCCFGLRLEKRQIATTPGRGLFLYDRRMYTIESLEHHTNDVVMKRFDPETTPTKYYALLDKYGITARPVYPRYDASHFQLDIIRYSSTSGSYLNGFDLRRLRTKVERGDEITAKDMNFPNFFWFDGTPLNEM